jgi:2-desacetyl-2-hydroxyethyl bacteriochlorophyllide A dehydrogenase
VTTTVAQQATVLTVAGPRELVFEEVPLALGERDVLVETLASGISAGTELTLYRGTNPYLSKRWDGERRLFREEGTPSLTYPVRTLGYEEVGRVVALGAAAEGVAVGELVFGTWGHRTHHVMPVEEAARRRLPRGLEPRLGIFSHIGAIALNGVHDAQISIGDTVAVFGLGVPGQIVAQLATRAGARVVGVDLVPSRLRLAVETGAVAVAIDPREASPAETIKALTDGRGADVAIEVSGSARALHEAIRSVAFSSVVVAMGFLQGDAIGLALGEEFHHNRVTLRCSQISGVAPERAHRWDRVRLARTALELQADGALDLRPLVSHVVPFREAPAAFAMLDASPHEAMQVVLDFGGAA